MDKWWILTCLVLLLACIARVQAKWQNEKLEKLPKFLGIF